MDDIRNVDNTPYQDLILIGHYNGILKYKNVDGGWQEV